MPEQLNSQIEDLAGHDGGAAGVARRKKVYVLWATVGLFGIHWYALGHENKARLQFSFSLVFPSAAFLIGLIGTGGAASLGGGVFFASFVLSARLIWHLLDPVLLHLRLNEVTRNQRRVWYWVVTGMVLLLLPVAFIASLALALLADPPDFGK